MSVHWEGAQVALLNCLIEAMSPPPHGCAPAGGCLLTLSLPFPSPSLHPILQGAALAASLTDPAVALATLLGPELKPLGAGAGPLSAQVGVGGNPCFGGGGCWVGVATWCWFGGWGMWLLVQLGCFRNNVVSGWWAVPQHGVGDGGS